MSDQFGMDSAFYAMAGLNILAFALAVLFLPEVHISEGKEARPMPSFTRLMESSRMRGLFAFRMTNAMGRGVFFAFLPILAGPNSSIGLTLTEVGTVLTANILMISLFQMPFGRLGDKYDRRRLVALGSLMDVVILCIVPFMNSFAYLIGLVIIASIGRVFSLPSASAMAVGEGKKFGMASAMVGYNMAMSFGIAVGPILGGVVSDLIGVTAVFYFGAIAGLLGAGAFIYLCRSGE